jgi:hypothetical protein
LQEACAASRPDCVERVGLASRAALSPQPTHLEHSLTLCGQEAGETGTERAGALNRERTPTPCVLVDELQRLRVAVAVRVDRRLEDDCASDDMHDREGMRVAVRADTTT